MAPEKKWYPRSALWIWISAAVLVALDQAVKGLAVRYLKEGGPVSLIDGVFELRYLENPYAAFSFGRAFRTVFPYLVLTVTVILLGVLVYYSLRIPGERRFFCLRAVVVLILAGAVGNLIDRLRQGYVVDLLYFRLIDFPIFNVADIYVCVGAALFLWTMLFRGSLYEVFSAPKKDGSDVS